MITVEVQAKYKVNEQEWLVKLTFPADNAQAATAGIAEIAHQGFVPYTPPAPRSGGYRGGGNSGPRKGYLAYDEKENELLLNFPWRSGQFSAETKAQQNAWVDKCLAALLDVLLFDNTQEFKKKMYPIDGKDRFCYRVPDGDEFVVDLVEALQNKERTDLDILRDDDGLPIFQSTEGLNKLYKDVKSGVRKPSPPSVDYPNDSLDIPF